MEETFNKYLNWCEEKGCEPNNRPNLIKYLRTHLTEVELKRRKGLSGENAIISKMWFEKYGRDMRKLS